MIQIPSGVRAWIAAGYTDMRSPALTVQEIVKRDPHAGDLYIFRERRGDLVKILGMTRPALSSSAAVSCNPRARNFAHETVRVMDEAIDLSRWRTACDLEADAPVRIMQQQRHKLHR
ncbi:transposase [Bradyrhizobium sp. RT4a]